VRRRLQEELDSLEVEVNEEKTRIVNLAGGESFDFLGFRILRARSRRGKWFALKLPTVKKRTALLQELKGVFRSHRSQPAGRVIREINPIVEGWVNYFAHGHASDCFSYVRDWVEKMIRRHFARNSKRSGFGWKRWSRRWLYTHLGLFGGYRVRGPQPKALPV
jgi:RNA-directed DNA polymerase